MAGMAKATNKPFVARFSSREERIAFFEKNRPSQEQLELERAARNLFNEWKKKDSNISPKDH